MNPNSELVARARRGDQGAFEALLRQYQHSVFAFVRSRVADQASAEDVAQEVFIAAYKNLPTLSDDERFAAWLFSIARHKVLMFYRQKQRRKEGLGLEADSLIAPPLQQQPEGMLDALLDGLPDDQRIILLMRFRDQLSYRDIAERLGMPIGTVGTLLHRARHVAALNYQKWSGATL